MSDPSDPGMASYVASLVEEETREQQQRIANLAAIAGVPPPPPSPAAVLLANVIDADDLEATDFAPIRWVVNGILPEGLCILGGAPKAGKSRLSLSVAVAVACGGYALGYMKVDPGSVLLLSLEDSKRRLKTRIKQLMQGQPFPKQLKVVPMGGWKPLPLGGLDAIRLWLEGNADARLVVIDTLAKVRPPSTGRQGDAYVEDTQLLAPLLELAAKHHVCILVCTHTRKANGITGGDWVEALIGSIAQAGAADCILLLERSRQKSEGSLKVTGRDLEEDVGLALEADALIGGWKVVGSLEEHRLSEARQTILDTLKASPEPMTPAAIAKVVHGHEGTTRWHVWKMAGDGLLAADAKGRYFIRDEAPPQETNYRERESSLSSSTNGQRTNTTNGTNGTNATPTVGALVRLQGDPGDWL